MPIKEELVKKAMSELEPTRTVRSRRSYINSHVYTKGQQDGQQVGIHKGVSGSKSSSTFIPG